MVDAASGGSINNETSEEAYELMETLDSENYTKHSDRIQKLAGVFEVDQSTAFAAQMSTIQQQLNQIKVQINAPAKVCELCGGEHSLQGCQLENLFAQNEQANYLNFQIGQDNSYKNLYPYNYNPYWDTTHPILSQRNNNNTLQPHQNFNAPQNVNAPEKKVSIEDMFSKIILKMDQTTEQVKKRLEETKLKFKIIMLHFKTWKDK